MKRVLVLLFGVMCLVGCERNAPTTYDKVAGHTYVTYANFSKALPDTLSFLDNGIIANEHNGIKYTYEQDDDLLIIRTKYVEYYLEVLHKKIAHWEGKYYYIRID